MYIHTEKYAIVTYVSMSPSPDTHEHESVLADSYASLAVAYPSERGFFMKNSTLPQPDARERREGSAVERLLV